MPFSCLQCLFPIIFLLSLLLSGCSNNFKSAMESVKAVIELNEDPPITAEQLLSTPYASILVKVNDGPSISLVLAYADKNTHNDFYTLTWVDSARNYIVTENGRIIQTSGLSDANLEKLTSKTNSIPLVGMQSWQATYDWSPGYRYNFVGNVSSDKLNTEAIETVLWTKVATHITETVHFDSLGSEFTNHFWVVATDSNRPEIIKSIQYVGPAMDKLEVSMIRPYIEPAINSLEEK